jgi:hypothetical protein
LVEIQAVRDLEKNAEKDRQILWISSWRGANSGDGDPLFKEAKEPTRLPMVWPNVEKSLDCPVLRQKITFVSPTW